MTDALTPLVTLFLAIVVGAASIAAATHALLSKRDPRSALAWVAFCLLVPIGGPILYILLGINRVRGRARRIYRARTQEDTSEAITEPPGTCLRPLSLVGEQVTGIGLHSCDEIRMLVNGEGLFPAMLEDIENASEKIYLTTYIFQNDHTGNKVADALLAATQRGVDVRIIVDGLGAIAYPPRIDRKLRKLKLQFRVFEPIKLAPSSIQFNMRNHRKILLVDSHCVYTGGQNISDRHLVEKTDNPKRARDLHFRLTGKIVDDFERAFLTDWNHCCHNCTPAKFMPSNSNNPNADTWARLILDGPNVNLDKLNEVLVGILSSARNRVWLMTPYFLPGFDLIGALLGAKLRGVDVRIMVPERTNIHLAHWAAQHNLRHILNKGLSVLLQPAPFIHTKAILIDDNYTLIGSANLDPRSLRLNFELGVEIFSESFNSQLAGYFEECMKESEAASHDKLHALPLWMRMRDAVAWLFTPYL